MKIEKDRTYRIVVARHQEPVVNMVYAEIGDDDYEVFGAFSGMDAGGGLFNQTDEGIRVSDDPGEFESRYSPEVVQEICTQLETLRAEFEEFNDDGDMIGFSESGLEFISGFDEDDNGVLEAYSDGASEDFIYDCQDEWNLDFYKD